MSSGGGERALITNITNVGLFYIINVSRRCLTQAVALWQECPQDVTVWSSNIQRFLIWHHSLSASAPELARQTCALSTDRKWKWPRDSGMTNDRQAWCWLHEWRHADIHPNAQTVVPSWTLGRSVMFFKLTRLLLVFIMFYPTELFE